MSKSSSSMTAYRAGATSGPRGAPPGLCAPAGCIPITRRALRMHVRRERIIVGLPRFRLFLLLSGDPLGVFLRDERLDAFGEQRARVLVGAVRRGVRQEDVFFVLQ